MANHPNRGRGRGRPRDPDKPQGVTLRLEADTLAALKATGPGWSGTGADAAMRRGLGLAPTDE